MNCSMLVDIAVAAHKMLLCCSSSDKDVNKIQIDLHVLGTFLYS